MQSPCTSVTDSSTWVPHPRTPANAACVGERSGFGLASNQYLAPARLVPADILSDTCPVLAMAIKVHSSPRFATRCVCSLEHRMHRSRTVCKGNGQGRAKPFIGAVGVDERTQPLGAIDRVSTRDEITEGLSRVGQVPQPVTWASSIPINEDPPVAYHQIPRCQIVVAEQIAVGGWDEHVPPVATVGGVCRARVVDDADHASDAGEVIQAQRLQAQRLRSGHILDRLAAIFVATKMARDIYPTVGQEPHVTHDAGSGRMPGFANGPADAHDGSAGIAPDQRLHVVVASHAATVTLRVAQPERVAGQIRRSPSGPRSKPS